jgi:hypothetical protein
MTHAPRDIDELVAYINKFGEGIAADIDKLGARLAAIDFMVEVYFANVFSAMPAEVAQTARDEHLARARSATAPAGADPDRAFKIQALSMQELTDLFDRIDKRAAELRELAGRPGR